MGRHVENAGDRWLASSFMGRQEGVEGGTRGTVLSLGHLFFITWPLGQHCVCLHNLPGHRVFLSGLLAEALSASIWQGVAEERVLSF